MNKRKINFGIFAVAFFCLITANNVSSQDVRFTQVFADPLMFNPAVMGMNPDPVFILHYRGQWTMLDNGYTTSSFTALYPIYINGGKRKLDVGVNLMQDKSGAFKSINAMLAIGYNLQISHSGFVNFSMLGGYVQQSLNTADLTFDNQYVSGSYNSNNPTNETVLNHKISYPDMGFGAMYYFNPTKDDGAKLNAYLGASAFHLAKPNESFTAASAMMPLRISYQGGIKFIGNKQMDFTPNVIVTTQKNSQSAAIGIYMDYHLAANEKAVVGLWVRRNDAIAVHIGYEYKNFIFGYSYDMPISDIKNYFIGANAQELSLAYKIHRSKKKEEKSAPSFENPSTK